MPESPVPLGTSALLFTAASLCIWLVCIVIDAIRERWF